MSIRTRLARLEALRAGSADIAKMTDQELAREIDLVLSGYRARAAEVLGICSEEVTILQIRTHGDLEEELCVLVDHLIYLGVDPALAAKEAGDMAAL